MITLNVSVNFYQFSCQSVRGGSREEERMWNNQKAGVNRLEDLSHWFGHSLPDFHSLWNCTQHLPAIDGDQQDAKLFYSSKDPGHTGSPSWWATSPKHVSKPLCQFFPSLGAPSPPSPSAGGFVLLSQEYLLWGAFLLPLALTLSKHHPNEVHFVLQSPCSHVFSFDQPQIFKLTAGS